MPLQGAHGLISKYRILAINIQGKGSLSPYKIILANNSMIGFKQWRINR